MLNLNSMMVGSENPKKMAEFYEKVFGKKPDMVDGDWSGWSVGASYFSVGSHDKVKGMSANPERLMFNFETADVLGEFERIKTVGATVVKEPYSIDPKNEKFKIATFADPDGNYFQLMSPWE